MNTGNARPGVTEELRLPARARALWAETREITRRAIGELTGDEGAYAIGGGTILAARWEHRESTDIDITVAEEAEPSILMGAESSEFRRGVAALGGRLATRADGKLLAAVWPVQKLDIWATTPKPGTGAGPAVVDGKPETVLSTTQILRGKLERGEDCLVRDVFDVVTAARQDRKSLIAAVNAAGREWAMAVAGIWRAAAREVGRRAETLATTAPVAKPGTLGIDGAAGIERAVFTKLEIGAETNRIVVRGTTGFGSEAPIVLAGDGKEAFESLGLNGYLRRRRPNGETIRKRARETGGRVETYTPIYVEREGRTTHWLDGE